MRVRRRGLTGPCAAALLGLDGFRDLPWSPLWCVPITGESGDRIIRARDWQEPVVIEGVPVCPVELVLRHLNAVPSELLGLPDGIDPSDRVELALEHALRDGHKIAAPRGGSMPGDVMLRRLLRQRGDEPPTGSYAETRALQLLRSWGVVPWRQVPVRRNGRIVNVADFMLPFASRRRPEVFSPTDGVLLEVDSRQFHAEEFDHDSRRNSNYDGLSCHWVAITANQIERQVEVVRRSIAGAFRRAGRPSPV